MLCFLPCCAVSKDPFRIQGESYLIQSREDKEELKAFSDHLDLICLNFKRLFRVRNDEIMNLTIFLEGQDQIFEIDEYPALYKISDGSIHFYRKPDLMLLLHEIAHHFIHHAIGEIPVWMNEGLATYLGWSAMDGERILTGEIPVVHYKAMKEMSRNSTLMPLKRFCSLSMDAFYNDAMSIHHYSQAWGIVFYLLHDHFPANLSFMDKIEKLAQMDLNDLSSLDEPFNQYWKGFSAAKMMEDRLSSWIYLRRLSSAFRLGLLQDPRSIDTLLSLASDRGKDVRMRIVCLYATAMIALRSGEAEVMGRLISRLEGLMQHPSQRMRESAFELHQALLNDERERIANRFMEIGRTGGFYPAGRFTVKGGEKVD